MTVCTLNGRGQNGTDRRGGLPAKRLECAAQTEACERGVKLKCERGRITLHCTRGHVGWALVYNPPG